MHGAAFPLTSENGVHPLLAEAASKIASSLIRKSATVGGICLDTRCFWYNQGEDWRRSIDWCHKADCGTGADCLRDPQPNTLCVATYQGDLAPNFMVLGASVVLMGPNGERTVPLSEFYELDGMKKNVLNQGEFLLKVVLPKDAGKRKGCYQKLRVRESWDFPEAGVAASWLPGDVFDAHGGQHGVGIHSTSSFRAGRDHLSAGELDPVALAKAVQKSVKPSTTPPSRLGIAVPW